MNHSNLQHVADENQPLGGSSDRVPPSGPIQVHAEGRAHDEKAVSRGWFHESPSWLTSLVIHLLIYLAVISISAPIRSRSGGSIVLTMSLGTDTRGSTSEIPDVLVPQGRLALGTIESRLKPVTQDNQPRARTMRSESHTKSYQEDSTDTNSPTYKYAALTRRVRVNTPLRSSSLFSKVDMRQRQEHDIIVERFIEYDVGRLQGVEGAEALRDFQALGPEAVPALVRGLNHSANLRASCPVGVIASKLMSTLHAANDPSLTQYAIDHIGDDVPQNAPYYRQLLALRDQWLRHLQGQSQRLTEMLVARGLKGEGATFELAMSLAESPSENLLVALESSDEDLSIPALVAMIQRRATMSPREKLRATRILHGKDLAGASDELKNLVTETTGILDKELAAGRSKPAPVRNAVSNQVSTAAAAKPAPRSQRLEDELKVDRWNPANLPWNRTGE